jgi:hypothetical protein
MLNETTFNINLRQRTIVALVDGAIVAGTFTITKGFNPKVTLSADFKSAASEAMGINIPGLSHKQALACVYQAAKLCMMAEDTILASAKR